MKANYRNEFEGIEVNIIRPLVYVRESETRDFSLRSHLPVINENCPACFEQPKVSSSSLVTMTSCCCQERARVKKLLSQEETMVPALFHNLRKALLPFMDENIYSEMKSVCSKIEERSKSSRSRQQQTPGAPGEQKRNKTSSAIAVAKGSKGVGEEDGEGEGEEDDTEVKEDSESQSLGCQDGYCVPCYELA
jgi:tRNA(Ile)-lysidine synthase TilS/MesJ